VPENCSFFDDYSCFKEIKDNLDSNTTTNYRQKDYYPFGMLQPGRTYAATNSYRYGFNGKENDNEVKGEGNQQDYGMRIYDPRLGRFLSVDPVTNKFPYLTPYQFASNSPISGVDLDGLEYYYSANGAYLGQIGKSQEVWTADKIETQTIRHADGTSTVTQVAVKPQNLNINHNEFTIISNIVKQEGITNDANEYLFIAHASNNAAKSDDVSMYNKLMSGFSSVKKENKVPLADNNKSNSALFARAGTISVLSGAKDPTGGATLWDGTDFLAWGLKSPNGTPQNKFEEYKSINIPGKIFSEFTLSNLEKYSGGCVKYGKEHYDLPASVFTNPNNKTADGGFQYNTGAKKPTGLKATATAGRSIFWKPEK
jgi:RHS repeat-associated protein